VTLERLLGAEVAPEDWVAATRELKERRARLVGQHQATERDLYRLGVDERSYLAEDSLSEYNQELLLRLEADQSALKQRIQSDESRLNTLKQAICAVTGDPIGLEWEQLLDHLKGRLDEKTALSRSLTATIVAGLLTNSALADLREAEHDELEKGLQSPVVLQTLRSVTGRYDQLTLDGVSLIVSDPYGSYKLGSLSTGTREQVLLALRIGFAAHLLGGSSLFLILDDAFQHSDWRRREYLIDQVLDLGEQGWQITYLTMDDQIRDRFQAKAVPRFGGAYCYQGLPDALATPLPDRGVATTKGAGR
jgi:uncharacterized protein YhaN